MDYLNESNVTTSILYENCKRVQRKGRRQYEDGSRETCRCYSTNFEPGRDHKSRNVMNVVLEVGKGKKTNYFQEPLKGG